MRLATILLGLFAAEVLLAAGDESVFSERKKNHWAWKAPVRSTLPDVKNKAWVRNPIDAFILSKLEAAGLEPTAPATKEQLLRRVTFDLTGLPPTPAEIDAFLSDSSRKAWEKVIDRLLASPHYGERWGRHWLDLARFAESNGYEHDEIRPDAWRYRDYVIDAFNSDIPYDRFIKEQLAGDELFPEDSSALVATAFNLLGPDMTDNASQAQRRQNTLDDMTDTTGLAFLGMTIGCARCHDHKFEPIPQTDFYRLQAFFTPAVFRKDIPVASAEQRRAYEAKFERYQNLVKPATDALQELEQPVRDKIHQAKLAKLAETAKQAHLTPPEKRTAAQKELVGSTLRFLVISPKETLAGLSEAERERHKALQTEIKKYDSQKPAPLPSSMGLSDGAEVAKTFLLKRGELRNPAEEVTAGYLMILSPGHRETPTKVQSPRTGTTGRRTALANWIANPSNPLTARVMVNRIWHHHFGRGIVATPSDFGLRGLPPTHPELLDWLAIEFVERGWSIKEMHRLMLSSATYQMSTNAKPQAAKQDPDNLLFSRMNRLRLEGEVIRDSLLVVSGRLNPKRGGPGVFPPLAPEAVRDAKNFIVTTDPAEQRRKSIYVFARRNVPMQFLQTFDLPDSNQSCSRRERSTTAPQALALLNSADVVEAAKQLAQRLQKETSDERVSLGYRLVLGRRPSDSEVTAARDFLATSPLSEFCRALFNVNEFIYLD